MADTKRYLDYDGLKVFHKNIENEMQKQVVSNYINDIEMVWGPMLKEMYDNYISSNDWVPFSDYVTKNKAEINGTLNLFNNYDYNSLNEAIYLSGSYLLTTMANFTNGMIDEMEERFAEKGGIADVDLSDYPTKDEVTTAIENGSPNLESISTQEIDALFA